MEKKTFSLFQARVAAEDYVSNIFEGTSTTFATKQVAVDPTYRCLVVSGTQTIDVIKQQCVCIFTVRYRGNGNSTVIGVDYVSDKTLSE